MNDDDELVNAARAALEAEDEAAAAEPSAPVVPPAAPDTTPLVTLADDIDDPELAAAARAALGEPVATVDTAPQAPPPLEEVVRPLLPAVDLEDDYQKLLDEALAGDEQLVEPADVVGPIDTLDSVYLGDLSLPWWLN